MGSGISQVCAQSGFDVAIYDVDAAQLANATASIAKFIRRGVEKGERTAEEAEAAIARVRPCADLAEAARDCDLVIEAILENMEAKKALFRQLDAICPEHTIIASNTSSLSVSEMATAYGRPQRFIGAHFFNPAPVMRLVELIRGAETAQETVDTMVDVVRTLGKTPVIVRDSPNFIVNRVSRPLYFEAQLMAMEGVLVQHIDGAARLGAGLRMGPLELLDLTGLAPHLASSETALREWGDPKWRPVPIVRTLVRAGHLGRRAGKGFYLYPAGEQTPRIPSPSYDLEPFDVKAVAVVGTGPKAEGLATKLGAAGYDTTLLPTLSDQAPSNGSAQMVFEAIESHDQSNVNELFQKLGSICSPGAVLVTTSPYFSPTELGFVSGRPTLTIGLHEPMPFMNRRFFEIGKGMDTNGRTVATALAVVKALGYQAIAMDEMPCYTVYRLIVPMINEAAFALSEGLASAEDIDTALKLGLNHPFGPLEWADKLGIDVVLRIMQALQSHYGDPRYRPSMLIRQMVRAGHLGEKTGRGFYVH